MGKHKEALKQAVTDEILGRLRRARDEGREEEPVLDAGWLYNDFLPSLSRAEEEALEEALAEMLHKGIITRTDGRRPTYRLTKKGAVFLCP
jgi:hypothetical protein